ncbi:hypothetical protein [Acrocarpospora phusangensis]|uniref:hypothetical protein n=1 Tax=Acrocarpospora phusangensis TaxID=1070424 RepID=UPI00195100F6|nr:hypothetical protein [Acrocarpospora phusangensis]
MERAARRAQAALRITAACHGEIGSSQVVFEQLTAVLIALLTQSAYRDEDLWEVWDTAWRR